MIFLINLIIKPAKLDSFWLKEFTREMRGTAEIIAEKRRLLKRLIDPIKFVFEKNVSCGQD